MDKQLLIGLLIGGSALGTAAGIGAYNSIEKTTAASTAVAEAPAPVFAEVVSAKPVVETYFTERQECHEEAVQTQAPPKDQNRVTGTTIGAVIGGVIGHQLGNHHKQGAATAAGAVAGAFAGNKIQENMQQNNIQTHMETRCETFQEPHQKITGYEVTYRLGEETGSVVMKSKPGDRLAVKDGVVVTETTDTPETKPST